MQVVTAAGAARDVPEKPAQNQKATMDQKAPQKPVQHLRGGSAAAQEGGTRPKTARSQDLPCQQPCAAAELAQDSPRPSSLPAKGQKVLTWLGCFAFMMCVETPSDQSVMLHSSTWGLCCLRQGL